MRGRKSVEIIAAAGYSIFLFLLSATPGHDIPGQVMSLSTVLHFILYMGYGAALFMFFKTPYLTYLAGGTFAASDEIHQYFVPGRTCDPFDFLTDITALTTILIIIILWKPLFTFLTSSTCEL